MSTARMNATAARRSVPFLRRSQASNFLRGSRVVVEQPAKPLAPTNATDVGRRLALNQFVAQPLMIPFAMIVSDKFRDSLSKMALAERNQPIETFPFNRADEALGVGVRVRGPIRRPDDADPRVLQACADRLYSTSRPGRRSARDTAHRRPP